MILKDLDPFQCTDRIQIAGRKAEEQMAFYLRRYFKSANNIYVINGLKIRLNGETAQIDHLVIHAGGLVIIESKSISEAVSITKDGQWIREYCGTQRGMMSPIIQAEMQGMVLADLIGLLTPSDVGYLAKDIVTLVAISDHGIIKWPEDGALAGVKKAEQICGEIIALAKDSYTADSELISHDEMLVRITPESWSHSGIVTRGWWALIMGGFLVDCSSVHDVVKQETQNSEDASIFEHEFYRMVWKKNMAAGLGEVDSKLRENLNRRLARLRLETAQARPVSISINRKSQIGIDHRQ